MKRGQDFTPVRDYIAMERKITDGCLFEGCGNPYFSRNYCAGHYYQQKAGKELKPLLKFSSQEGLFCPVPRCGDQAKVKGYCQKHIGLIKYSLNPDQLNQLFTNPKCAICGVTKTRKFHIDHDHSCCNGASTCGECIRGLLCATCNQGIGFLRDSPAILRAAAIYLESGTRV